MRMVSKIHVSPTSVKRFKKVHVIHKPYMSKKLVLKQDEIETSVFGVKPEKKVVEKEVAVDEPIPVIIEPKEKEQIFESTQPQKRSRKKRVVEETVKNNEENIESHE